jgi:ATP-binding cassette subfamily B protein
MTFPFYKQLNNMDCGPTCLKMVAKFYGKHYNTDSIRQTAGFNKEGVSLLGISEAAEKLGFRTRGTQPTYDQITKGVQLPCILHWDQYHFVVMIGVNKRILHKDESITIADPAKGIIRCTKKEFLQRWAQTTTYAGDRAGVALILEPTSRFYEREGEKEHKLTWKPIFQYLQQGRWQIAQIFIALLIGSLLQLIFPFLTQSIVDKGINTRNLQYITIVLIAQLMLVFSRTVVDYIRSRLLLYVSSIVNLSILSDFWIKLTKLPISYFDRHHTGDTLQRIGDNKQIQNFLTGNALTTLFSFLNFILYAIVLIMYNYELFLVFFIGSVCYFLWILLFLKLRRKINYLTFSISSKENNATLQMVQGMQEIKLNNAEKIKRWEWENIQAGIFNLNFKSLAYSQLQQAGAVLINQGKDVMITFLVARLVIEGQLTFGAMLAIQYIIGQLSSPIEQFVGFAQSAQDVKISMERLNEIHNLTEEEDINTSYTNRLPEQKNILIKNLSFKYSGAGNEPVLKGIDFEVLQGKVTAIVGVSGSGKTTLLKLLLKFYDLYEGEIKIGTSSRQFYTDNDGINFKYISPTFWRSQCGAVLQDGYIFNDTIAKNIAVGDEYPDPEKLLECCKIANILSFIDSLPNGFNTQLGAEGIGVSQGQKQRLLIARAIYKDPEFMFFDEATNALDANNERAIVENLQEFFKGRTVIVVAHRLSTVKNADKIVVLHQGVIVEEGTHEALSKRKGRYFELVKNQLELSH